MKKHIIASFIAAAVSIPAVQAETLNEVYNLAKAHDPSLRAANASYRADKEQVEVTRGNLFPSLSFSGNLGYTHTDPENTDSFNNTQNQLALNLDYPIYSPALDYGVDAVELTFASSGIALEQAQEQLIYDTLSDFFAVLTAQATLDTTRSQVKSYAGQLDRVKKQYEVGLVSITDLHDAQAAYDSILVTELNAQSNLTVALEALYQRTGQSIEEIPRLSDDYPIQVDPSLNAQDLIQRAMAANKNVRILDLSVDSAQNNINIQKANGRVPTVAITGSIARTDNDYSVETANRTDGATNTSSIGVGVTIPLYSGGAISASVRQATASAEAAVETRANSIQDIELSIRSAVLQLKTLAAQVKAQKQVIISSESALEATQAGYDVGTRNIVELLDAQSTYFDAKNTLEELRYSFVLQQITLDQLTGDLGEEDIQALSKWLI